MAKIGILAFGSLIEDPGDELSQHIAETIPNVSTPFSIEFARKSKTRGNGPTLIPVKDGGQSVNAQILVLKDDVEIETAKDLLWRRETRREEKDSHYSPPANPGVNNVIVESNTDFDDFDYVLYTTIGSNIEDRDPKNLAKLAIDSVKTPYGERGKDGINYLISVKRQGISTPLMSDYEEEILKQTGTESLEDAWDKIRREID